MAYKSLCGIQTMIWIDSFNGRSLQTERFENEIVRCIGLNFYELAKKSFLKYFTTFSNLDLNDRAPGHFLSGEGMDYAKWRIFVSLFRVDMSSVSGSLLWIKFSRQMNSFLSQSHLYRTFEININE